MPRTAANLIGGSHVAAFLDMLAFAEIGERLLRASDDGYNVIVGGRTFNDYARHPNISVALPKLKLHSTAAGRYQFLFWVWEDVAKVLGLADFSPASQDRACVLLLRRAKALDTIKAGKVEDAIRLCKATWASLPGAGYGQPEKKMGDLVRVYHDALEAQR